jgi:hypothetical protein
MFLSSAQWVPKFPMCSPRVRVRENSLPHLCLWVRERTHLPFALSSNHTSDNLLANRILDGRTDPDTPKRIPITLSDTLTLRDTWHWVIPITLSDTLVVKPIYTCKWMCMCVWLRENSPPHLCLWVRERTHLPSALPSNHTLDKSRQTYGQTHTI